MSMDDTYALATAIVRNEDIQLPVGQGAFLYARVILATIHCDHRNGEFSGSVNYILEGDEYVSVDTFYSLWLDG